MHSQLEKIESQFAQLEKQLQDPKLTQDRQLYNETCREFSKLKPTVDLYREYKKLCENLKTHQEMKKEDHELALLVEEEIEQIQKQIQEVEIQLKNQLAPKDPLDEKNIILELRAGAGGDEAGLFCRELFEVYKKYCDVKKWKCEVLSCAVLSTGGFREVISRVSGAGVYARMKFEKGVHRVQRVPKTESQGRVHTSTVTTAVLPEAQRAQVKISAGDIRVDVCRSSGAGGQHVNTTDSAVRVVHLPTKITVYCQEEKSQHANKEKAFKILYARLLDLQEKEKKQKDSQMRLEQIGKGGRSEKIRTYNFPQSRVTDHRLGFTTHALDQVMKGELDILINPLMEKPSGFD